MHGPWSLVHAVLSRVELPLAERGALGTKGPWTKDGPRTKHARGVDMESALVLIEERDDARLERVLRADDTQAVALNQGFEQL